MKLYSASKSLFSLMVLVLILVSCNVKYRKVLEVRERSEAADYSRSVLITQNRKVIQSFRTPEWDGACAMDSSKVLYALQSEDKCRFDVFDINGNPSLNLPLELSIGRKEMPILFLENCNDNLFCAFFSSVNPVQNFDASLIKNKAYEDDNFYPVEIVWLKRDAINQLKEVKRLSLVAAGKGIYQFSEGSIIYPNGDINMFYPFFSMDRNGLTFYDGARITYSDGQIGYSPKSTGKYFHAHVGSEVVMADNSISYMYQERTYTYNQNNHQLSFLTFGPQCKDAAYFFTRMELPDGHYRIITFVVDFKKSKIKRLNSTHLDSDDYDVEYRCLCDE